jgi:hypothetical protein
MMGGERFIVVLGKARGFVKPSDREPAAFPLKDAVYFLTVANSRWPAAEGLPLQSHAGDLSYGGICWLLIR